MELTLQLEFINELIDWSIQFLTRLDSICVRSSVSASCSWCEISCCATSKILPTSWKLSYPISEWMSRVKWSEVNWIRVESRSQLNPSRVSCWLVHQPWWWVDGRIQMEKLRDTLAAKDAYRRSTMNNNYCMLFQTRANDKYEQTIPHIIAHTCKANVWDSIHSYHSFNESNCDRRLQTDDSRIQCQSLDGNVKNLSYEW